MSRLLFTLLLFIKFSFVWSEAQEIQTKHFKGVDYQYVIVSSEQLRLVWKNDKGEILRQISKAKEYVKSLDDEPLHIMNGGIFEPDYTPSGLLIIDRQSALPLNLKEGKGNFYLKPNGVFFFGEEKAGVMTTDKFKQMKFAPKFAVQSGPILLDEGSVHPAFKEGSSFRLLRNGVGVKGNNQIVLAISDFRSKQQPNLYDFAMFFREMGCKNALYLDGTISQMRSGRTLNSISRNFASMIVVIEN